MNLQKRESLFPKVKNLFGYLTGNIFYFAVAMVVMSFGWAVLEIVTPLFLKEGLGISYLGFGVIMSAIGILGAVAKLLAGITDVHGRLSTLTQFENPNKVVDTLCILEKKGNIAASQGVMRKIITETRSDPPGPHLNTWTCSMCGIKFKAQIPYEDHDGHAVCEDCWEELISEEHS